MRLFRGFTIKQIDESVLRLNLKQLMHTQQESIESFLPQDPGEKTAMLQSLFFAGAGVCRNRGAGVLENPGLAYFLRHNLWGLLHASGAALLPIEREVREFLGEANHHALCSEEAVISMLRVASQLDEDGSLLLKNMAAFGTGVKIIACAKAAREVSSMVRGSKVDAELVGRAVVGWARHADSPTFISCLEFIEEVCQRDLDSLSPGFRRALLEATQDMFAAAIEARLLTADERWRLMRLVFLLHNPQEPRESLSLLFERLRSHLRGAGFPFLDCMHLRPATQGDAGEPSGSRNLDEQRTDLRLTPRLLLKMVACAEERQTGGRLLERLLFLGIEQIDTAQASRTLVEQYQEKLAGLRSSGRLGEESCLRAAVALQVKGKLLE